MISNYVKDVCIKNIGVFNAIFETMKPHLSFFLGCLFKMCFHECSQIFKLFNHFGRSKIICYIHEINGYFEYIL